MARPETASTIARPTSRRVPDAVPLAAQPFDLSQVRLLEGPYKAAMDKNAEYLLSLEPDRLLHRFRVSAGLEPKGEAYGGWEQATIAGHTLGHFLTAVSHQWRASGDGRFLEIARYVVNELKECQDARGDGYVGGVPEGDRLWDELRRGHIASKGFDLNGIWVPWYNLHKLWMGLYDAYTLCGLDDAFEVLVKLSDWAIDVTRNLSDEQWQRMLDCEHGGMNEALAQVYGITGERRFLELAFKFNHRAVLEPLAQGKDALPGLHGNTQIPKVIGAARQYELTGEARFRDIAVNFWNQVVRGHTYAIGGHGSGEYFGPSGRLADRLTMSTAETCNTYNMLKLTKRLFSWEPKVEYADYYEQAMLNHILPSQDPETGMLCYFVSLHPGHFKTFSTPYDAFWCCVGTGIENHTRYGEAVYFHAGDELYVAQYVPSELDWREKRVRLRMETAYPDSEKVVLSVEALGEVPFKLKLRCPAWASGPVRAQVRNVQHLGAPGGWLEIERVWRGGDRVEVRVPMSLRVLPTPDNAFRAALAYGPSVLAGDLGQEGIEAPMPFSSDQTAYFGVACPPVPVLVTNGRHVDEWVRRAPGGTPVFETAGVGRPFDVTLVPFHKIGRRRYTVYWDLFDEKTWEERQEEHLRRQEEQRRLQAATVDFVQFGEMQPERDHAVDGERTVAQGHAGRKMRLAWGDGWFGCTLKAPESGAASLAVDYWGQDGRNREFEVLVDGEPVAQEAFTLDEHNRFFTRIYALGRALVEGKTQVTVVFRSRNGKIVGPVCSCRLLRG